MYISPKLDCDRLSEYCRLGVPLCLNFAQNQAFTYSSVLHSHKWPSWLSKSENEGL